jgi:hypothetical protein
MSLWFDDGLDECLFFLFGELNVRDMGIDGLIPHFVVSRLRRPLLQLKILLEMLKPHSVSLVVLKAHILSQDDVLADLRPHLVQIPIVEQPVLGEEYLIRQMGRLYLRRPSEQGSWDVRVDGVVGGEVKPIVDLLFLNAIVLPIVLLGNLLEFNHSNICSLFNLRK